MIEIALLTFCAQGLLVFLLGFQSLNVRDGHYVLACIGSLLLGVLGYFINAAIAKAGIEGFLGPVWWSFVLAGPVGICCAMKSHPYVVAFYQRITRHESTRQAERHPDLRLEGGPQAWVVRPRRTVRAGTCCS